MSTIPRKVFIQVESTSEQQENLKNCRKTLKVLQKDGVDKENLAGRTIMPSQKGIFKKSKSETTVNSAASIADFKRKKSSLSTDSPTEKTLAEITEDDLTTEGEPSEHYWKTLAEKRRVALEDSLHENEMLHEKVTSLEVELTISRAMLDETKNLVEVLTEMINEPDEEGGQRLPTDSDSDTDGQVPNISMAEEAKEG